MTTFPIRPPAKTALVVDDEPWVRMAVRDMLEEFGYVVHEASHVTEALAFLKLFPVDLLVTDVAMPGTRNGLTLANHVSYLWPNTRIIVTSGARRPYPGELPEGGKYIPKPMSRDDLQRSLGAI